jgi:nucleoside-diphosphate-sugar epimerase
MSRIAILGAAGGLGSACVARAVAAGHETLALMRVPRADFFDPRAQLLACDAADRSGLTRMLEGCDALLYCVNAPLARWIQTLPRLLANAIEACRAADVRLVFPGNVWSYGPGRGAHDLIDEARALSPTSTKGRLRAVLETMLAESGIRQVIVRLPEFYGPNVANPLMGAPFRAALAGRTITWLGGRLDVTVEYLFVPDGAAAMLKLALADDVEGQRFHVPGVAPTTPRAFFELVQSAASNRQGVRTLAPWLMRTAALFARDAREFVDIQHLWTDPILLDGARYRERFGALPATPYAAGIRETLAWFRAHPNATNSN